MAKFINKSLFSGNSYITPLFFLSTSDATKADGFVRHGWHRGVAVGHVDVVSVVSPVAATDHLALSLILKKQSAFFFNPIPGGV